MALIKNVNWKYNISVSYWRIDYELRNRMTNTVSVRLYPYFDIDTRIADINEYINEMVYEILIPGYNLTKEEIYTYIKGIEALPFADATDDFTVIPDPIPVVEIPIDPSVGDPSTGENGSPEVII